MSREERKNYLGVAIPALVLAVALPLICIGFFMSSTEDTDSLSDVSFKQDGYHYEITSTDQVELRLHDGGESSLTLPTTVSHGGQSYSVTSIGNGAFKGIRNLNHVIIPESVAELKNSAFAGCMDLKTVHIPSATCVGEYAFAGCINLETVFCSGTLESVGDHAFMDCNSLVTVTGGSASGDWADKPFVLNVPKNVGAQAFANCSFQYLIISDVVESIGPLSFERCSNLRYVEAPISTNLGAYMRSGAFSSCTNIEHMHFTKGTGVGVDYGKGDNNHCEDLPFFFSKKSLKEVKIEEGVTHLGDYTFYFCRALEHISLPNTLESIGEYSFVMCDSLERLILPDSLRSVGYSCFAGCGGIKELSVPISLGLHYTSYSSAYRPSSVLEKVTFTQGTGEAYDYGDARDAMWHMAGTTMKTVIFSEGVKSIGRNTISGCLYVKNIHFNSDLEYIHPGAFRGFTFYDRAGECILTPTAQNLMGHSFTGMPLKMIMA